MTPKENSRLKIMQAAYEAFAEKGYSETRMDDIVRLSGLSKGTLYWHFKNKQELFVATLQMVMGLWDEQLVLLVAMEGTAEDRIRRFFNQSGDLFQDNKNLIGLLIDGFFQSYQNEQAQTVMKDVYARFVIHVEKIIQQGIDHGEFCNVDPHLAAISLMAGGDGVALYVLLEPDWDMVNALNTLVDLVLRGLRKE